MTGGGEARPETQKTEEMLGLSCPHDDFMEREGFLELYGGSIAGSGGLLGSRDRKAGWGRRRRDGERNGGGEERGEDPKSLRTSHDLHLLQVHHLTTALPYRPSLQSMGLRRLPPT